MGEDVAPRRARRVRWPLLVAGIAMLLVGGWLAWLAVDGWRLRSAADDLQAHAAAARDALGDRDAETALAEIEQVSAAAHDFAGATRGPHWWIAERLPWLGDQVAPLRVVGPAVEAIADEAIAPLAAVDGLALIEEPPLADGRIDPFILEPYREPLAQAAATLEREGRTLSAVDLGDANPVVQRAFVGLEGQVEQLAGIVEAAAHTAELLPAVLGGEGARQYIVMVQNNAEPRTSGGIPGAVIQLTVDEGKVTFGRYATEGDLLPPEPIPLTEDEERIFTYRLGYFPQDVNFTPEFPRTAELLGELWESAYGTAPDGVISVDPVALGWMLGGAAPVEADGFEITSANLAHVMLNRVYFRFEDPAEQDAFFARTSRDLFTRLLEGPESLLDGVEHAVDDQRLRVWFARPAEQALLAETTLAGMFLEDGDAVGVFVNDGSGSKIGYYVDMATTVTDAVCTDGTVAGQTVEVSFTHLYEGDPAELPVWVSGGGRYVPAGQFQANLLVYPADGTVVTGVYRDGEPVAVVDDAHAGRPLSQRRVTLDPGQSVTYRYDIAVDRSSRGAPAVLVTPGPRDNGVERVTVDSDRC